MQNPYNNKNMLPHDSDMFFGRERELRHIEALLNSENPQSVSIVGERRIGKSSAANRVFHKMNAAENTLAVFLNCDSLTGYCNSKDEFFQILNKEFSDELKDKPDLSKTFKPYTGNLFHDYGSFRSFMKKQGNKGIRFIIFLDEFEHVPEKEFADDSFFSNLRWLASNPENRMAFVTISQNYLEKLTHQAVKSSGFWNIFTPQIIGLLDDESINALRAYGFDKNNLFLEKQEIEKIEFYADNFPFFNQIVCRHLFESKTDNCPLDESALAIELFPHYKNLWKNRTEQEQHLLQKLKKRNIRQDISLNEMEKRGILKKVKDDVYRPFSRFFFDLINDKSIEDENFNLNRAVRYIKYAAGFLIGFKAVRFIGAFISSIIASLIANQFPNKDGE